MSRHINHEIFQPSGAFWSPDFAVSAGVVSTRTAGVLLRSGMQHDDYPHRAVLFSDRSTTTISAAVLRLVPALAHSDGKDRLCGSAETCAPRPDFTGLKTTAANPTTHSEFIKGLKGSNGLLISTGAAHHNNEAKLRSDSGVTLGTSRRCRPRFFKAIVAGGDSPSAFHSGTSDQPRFQHGAACHSYVIISGLSVRKDHFSSAPFFETHQPTILTPGAASKNARPLPDYGTISRYLRRCRPFFTNQSFAVRDREASPHTLIKLGRFRAGSGQTMPISKAWPELVRSFCRNTVTRRWRSIR